LKTLTAAANSVWKRKHGRHETFTVEYKKRYWNGSAYVYQAAWTVMDPSDNPPPSGISWKLDTTTQNTILASNVSLTLDNSGGKWLPTTYEPSIFAVDATATLGYEPYMTKFRIQHGYVLDDGTTELVSLFLGYLADLSIRGGESTVTYTIKGSEILLEQADAQNVSDAFTLEDCSPATADGTNTEFYTTSVGVWQISSLEQNSVEKTQGTHYKLSQLDETGPALITMVTAPTAGHTMKVTGKKWKANQAIETLIGLLCDEAGIGSGVRTINPVIIPGSASGSKTITTQADWEAGTVLSYINTTNAPDSIISGAWREIADFDGGSSDGFTLSGVATIINFEGSDYRLDVSGGAGYGYKASAIAYGSWQADLHNWADSISADADFQFIRTSGGNSYGVIFGGSGAAGTVGFSKNGAALGSPYTMDTSTAPFTVRVTRSTAGEMKLYINGTLRQTATDADYTTCEQIRFNAPGGGGGGDYAFSIDNIYVSGVVDATGDEATETVAVFESAVQDILSTPTAWGTLEYTETLNGGTITYATASSSDNVTYEAYADISGGVMQSTLARYFKVRATFTLSSSGVSPQLDELVANFQVSAINLTIAIFKGKNCFQAITDLAKISDYEWGFEGDGDFFFRSKTVSGDADFDLDQDNAILEMTQYRPGWDRITNIGQVRYGAESQYYAEYNATLASESSPTSQEKYSSKIKSESMPYLLANDLNLGAARARVLYDGRTPRARVNLTLWMTPHIDLADIVSVSYFTDPKKRHPMIGDNLMTWENAEFGDPGNVILRDKHMKVVGVTYNIKQGTTDLELLEIL